MGGIYLIALRTFIQVPFSPFAVFAPLALRARTQGSPLVRSVFAESFSKDQTVFAGCHEEAEQTIFERPVGWRSSWFWFVQDTVPVRSAVGMFQKYGAFELPTFRSTSFQNSFSWLASSETG